MWGAAIFNAIVGIPPEPVDLGASIVYQVMNVLVAQVVAHWACEGWWFPSFDCYGISYARQKPRSHRSLNS